MFINKEIILVKKYFVVGLAILSLMVTTVYALGDNNENNMTTSYGQNCPNCLREDCPYYDANTGFHNCPYRDNENYQSNNGRHAHRGQNGCHHYNR